MAQYEIRYSRPSHKLGTWGSAAYIYPDAVEFEARDRLGTAPEIWARAEMRNGVPEVVDYRIKATKNGKPIRTSTLEALPRPEDLAIEGFKRYTYRRDDPVVVELLAGSNPGLNEIAHAAGPKDDDESWAIENELRSAQEGNKGPAESELELVARIYRESVAHKPVEAVQFALGTSYRTAARRVEQARAAGLLPKTTKGRRNA